MDFADCALTDKLQATLQGLVVSPSPRQTFHPKAKEPQSDQGML